MARGQQTERPEGTMEQAREKGQELVSEAQAQVQEKAQDLRDEADVRLREQLEERSTQTGEQVRAVAGALRQSSTQLRTQGKGTPARMVDQVAQRAEDLGSYLESAGADRILNDVESFARRRPWLVGAAGVAAGFVASRFLKASSDRRFEAQGGYRHGGNGSSRGRYSGHGYSGQGYAGQTYTGEGYTDDALAARPGETIPRGGV